jgi:predicted esterase
MTYPNNLGGVIMFSGFNFDFTPMDNEKQKIPILAINGLSDETVIIRHVRNSFYNFKKLKFNFKLIEETGLFHCFSKSGLQKANDLLVNKKI